MDVRVYWALGLVGGGFGVGLKTEVMRDARQWQESLSTIIRSLGIPIERSSRWGHSGYSKAVEQSCTALVIPLRAARRSHIETKAN